MHLTFTTRIIAPFVGTSVVVAPTADQLKFNIQTMAIPSGSSVTVDWGDGTVDTLTKGYNVAHTYAAPGTYTIRISDTITALAFCVAAATATLYGPLVRKVTFNTTKLANLSLRSLAGLTNVTSIDLTGTNIAALPAALCADDTSLETFYAPKIKSCLAGSDTNLPFQNCPALTTIHFAAAHESTIKASAAYQADPKLGAANAEVLFDL